MKSSQRQKDKEIEHEQELGKEEIGQRQREKRYKDQGQRSEFSLPYLPPQLYLSLLGKRTNKIKKYNTQPPNLNYIHLPVVKMND